MLKKEEESSIKDDLIQQSCVKSFFKSKLRARTISIFSLLDNNSIISCFLTFQTKKIGFSPF